MQAIVETFDCRASANAGAAAELRRIKEEMLRLLARFVPPRQSAGAAALPPEFYKYPPV